MMLHIATVATSTALLGWFFWPALAIAGSHWIIDGIKVEFQKRGLWGNAKLFVLDQILHLMSIVFIWASVGHHWPEIQKVITLPLLNYEWSLLALAYVLISTPAGYLIKHVTQSFNQGSSDGQKGGRLIGIFERIIILTFVLLNQYEAIGFLITGKSIIRFAGKDEHLRSEYVLLGTMLSYAIAITVGVMVKQLLLMN